MVPSPSAREQERLEAVRRYAILDTPPDGAFDRLATLAARWFDVPISTVSIVDHDRIWFKAAHGLDAEEVGRDPGLCASAILQHDPYIVTDAIRDPRTLENPLVRGELGVRFYAAAPIRTRDGHNLGTLNVIAGEPRQVTSEEMATLQDLAGIVADELELRLAAHRAVAFEQRVRAQQQAAIAELGQWALSADDPWSVGALARNRAAELLGPGFRVELAWCGAGTEQPPGEGVSIAIGTAGVLRVVGAEPVPAEDHEFLRSLAHVVQTAVQRHEHAAALEHLGTHDALTGLPNRCLLLDRIEQVRAACERSGERFAVLLLDLDRFKSINDGWGHAVGDEVLRVVADRLRDVAGASDSIARFGGDEFALLCPGVGGEYTGEVIAERIRTALAGGLETDHGTVSVTGSIGIAFGDGAIDGAALLREVDTAMYAAKTAGRNRTTVFVDRMQHQADERSRVAAALRTALEHDSVGVAYQPIISLATGHIVGVEALARLRSDDGTATPPNEFIWVAEQIGLIVTLGEQVLRRACVDAHPWMTADPDFLLSVNLSPRQLTHPDLATAVETILTETGFDPTKLVLEITETTWLDGIEVSAAMCRLRERGIRFAIDDFGTGYSSLAHLRHTPVDLLKIDRSFVGGLENNLHDHALVAASIQLAHAFELTTVAEGVETPEQLTELTRLGCDYAQGYLWSPPIDASDIVDMANRPGSA